MSNFGKADLKSHRAKNEVLKGLIGNKETSMLGVEFRGGTSPQQLDGS